MVPSSIVVLERLPLTPNGKLDRRALPAPEVLPAASHRAPRNAQEAILCGLVAELLGLSRIGIDDNFFELGGDSIVSIQLVSRARRAGLSITPRAVFQHQTVEALAAVAGVVPDRAAVGRRRWGGGGAFGFGCCDLGCAPASGHLPLTPIMGWLSERGGPIDRFSQGMLLQVPAGLSEEHLRSALQALLDHHDALRLRLDWLCMTAGLHRMRRAERAGTGVWRLRRRELLRRAPACGGWTCGRSTIMACAARSPRRRRRRRPDCRLLPD